MKCSQCHRFVTNVYNGCDWCKMPKAIKQQLDGLDEIANKARELANINRSWIGYESIIKLAGELRIDIYDQHQKSKELILLRNNGAYTTKESQGN